MPTRHSIESVPATPDANLTLMDMEDLCKSARAAGMPNNAELLVDTKIEFRSPARVKRAVFELPKD